MEKPKDEIRQNLEKITIAPDFEYTTLEGKTISLKDSENKLLVLEWWSIDCLPCIEQIPENNRIYKRFGSRDNILYPIASDPLWQSGIKDKFNVSGRPVTILIKNRKIVEKFKGKPEDGVL